MGAGIFADWKAGGAFAEIGGRQVFYRQGGDTEARTAVVFLHGFPTHSADFRLASPVLESRLTRVVYHDHLGFGLSDKPVPSRLDAQDKQWGQGDHYSYSLLEQAETAVALWRQLGIERVHIVAHDYGTSIATELIARREKLGLPLEVASVTLCNGSVHLELASVTLIQKALKRPRLGPLVARLSREPVFRNRIRNTFATPDAVSAEDVDAMWAGIAHNEGPKRISAISRYLDERYLFWHRWIGALTRLDLPVQVLWGRQDPIAVPAIAERLAAEIPSAKLTWIEGAGHYPMLEKPDAWSNAVADFIETQSGA